MEAISHVNIKISGFPFQRIISLTIKHNPNEHGTAEIVGEIDAKQAVDIVRRVDEKTDISITTSAKGQPEMLFYGCVGNLLLERGNEYSQIRLQLHSVSRRTDIVKGSRTFQNTGKKYKDIVSEVIKKEAPNADLDMRVTDLEIGNLIMRYNETAWEFAKRMAAKLHAPLIAAVNLAYPQIYIGLPPGGKKIKVKEHFFSYGSNVSGFVQSSSGMAEDFAGEWVETDQYGYLGDCVTINGKERYVRSVEAGMKNGLMYIRYGLMPAAGSTSCIEAQPENSRAAGHIMTGVVKEVKGNKVKVHLAEIDEMYDAEGDWEFPFSTVYASGDGSGWYNMPEVGDEVRVLFPSGKEEDAFAASSVNEAPMEDPHNKRWRAPGGKEILLTDQGLYITAKSGRVFINLTDEDGVEIHSDRDINISSDTKVNIISGGGVNVVAKKQITIGTEGAYLNLSDKTATLAADKVLIN